MEIVCELRRGEKRDNETLPAMLINEAIKKYSQWDERLLVKLSCYESPLEGSGSGGIKRLSRQ